MTKSKNSCPSCGGKEWDCYAVLWAYDGRTTAEPIEDQPAFVDLPWDDLDDTIGFDECRNCGATVS